MDSNNKTTKMSVVQCRMARIGLGLGVRDLAEIADVAPNTVFRFERGDELKPRTVKAMQDALKDAGAQFFVTDDGAESVSITKK